MSVFDVHVPSPAEVWAEIVRAEAESRPYFRFRQRRADGSVRDLEAYSSPVDLGDRKLHYAIMYDVTERKEAEAALQRSQAVAHIGHWTWDTRSNTVTWSDEMKRIFGLDPDQFAGDLNQVIEHSIHPDDAARVRAMNAAVIDGQRPGETEYRVVWPDGSVHYVQATPGDNVRDEQGSILQLAGVVQDVTEHKLRELEREQLLLQLQDQAEQLAQVMRSVREGVLLLDNMGCVLLANPRAEEMLGQLAAYADDRRILQLGGTVLDDLLTSPPGLTERERARMLTVIEQAQRATRMIRQILDFSRRSVLERQALDLLPLLKEEEKLLRQTLPESIEMVSAWVPGEYVVKADPTRIQQLVMNLAVNARDAMPHGGQLRIGLAKLAVPDGKYPPVPGLCAGEWVRIDVQDTGMGILPEHMAHIFEPFFTTKEPGKGTGLGLAQAHGIVAQHDGHITVASEPRVGTTFSVYLPALALGAPQGSSASVDAALPRGSGERILIVEDNAELLQSLGYRVEQAANGEEALARLTDPAHRREASVDLILSDMVMPHVGGAALLTALRGRGLAMPVILMSGHPLGEDIAALEQLGMAAWLDKPPGGLQLARAIAGALDSAT